MFAGFTSREHLRELLRIRPLTRIHEGGERVPAVERHRDVGLAVDLPRVVDLQDVVVLELGQRLPLTAEALEDLAPSVEPVVEDLDRHDAAELLVDRGVDDADVAPPGLADEAVGTELARQQLFARRLERLLQAVLHLEEPRELGVRVAQGAPVLAQQGHLASRPLDLVVLQALGDQLFVFGGIHGTWMSGVPARALHIP